VAITVCTNCVNFGSYVICNDPEGIYISGAFTFNGPRGINPTHAMGETRAYIAGGQGTPLGPGGRCAITRFQFASSFSSAAIVGCLNTAREGGAGASSSTHGYVAGGKAPPSQGGQYNDAIDKFQFADSANATDVGDLTYGRCDLAGAMSTTKGYAAGGRHPDVDNIDKYPFASDTNGTDSGDLICEFHKQAGHSSRTHAYFSGGTPSARATTIQKFSFAAEGNASDVGELTRDHVKHACANSGESGYAIGGFLGNQSTKCQSIDKFPFASDSGASDIGDLTTSRVQQTGVSSFTHGYSISGNPPGSGSPTVEFFPFASDSNASDTGGFACFQHTHGHGHQC
jgi:hypothetical protein